MAKLKYVMPGEKTIKNSGTLKRKQRWRKAKRWILTSIIVGEFAALAYLYWRYIG
jgi:hypothetical protein